MLGPFLILSAMDVVIVSLLLQYHLSWSDSFSVAALFNCMLAVIFRD